MRIKDLLGPVTRVKTKKRESRPSIRSQSDEVLNPKPFTLHPRTYCWSLFLSSLSPPLSLSRSFALSLPLSLDLSLTSSRNDRQSPKPQTLKLKPSTLDPKPSSRNDLVMLYCWCLCASRYGLRLEKEREREGEKQRKIERERGREREGKQPTLPGNVVLLVLVLQPSPPRLRRVVLIQRSAAKEGSVLAC